MTIAQQYATPEGTLLTYNAPFTHADLHRAPRHPAVERYGYEECAASPVERAEPATTRLVLIIELGAPLEVGAAGAAVRHARGFVAGLVDRPTRTWHNGRQAGIQINLDAPAASRLLGIPLVAIGDGVHAIDDVLDPTDRKMLPRLRSTDDWTVRLGLIDDWLARKLCAEPDTHRDAAGVAYALDRLEHTRGNLRIAALAKELGWSERHLQRAFEHGVGMAPKRYARIARFAALRRAMLSGKVASLADAAISYGFADQAHLTREVQRLAGSSPKALLNASVEY